MMFLRARDNNIQSLAYIWLHKGNQNEFLKHPKIKWLNANNMLVCSSSWQNIQNKLAIIKNRLRQLIYNSQLQRVQTFLIKSLLH